MRKNKTKKQKTKTCNECLKYKTNNLMYVNIIIKTKLTFLSNYSKCLKIVLKIKKCKKNNYFEFGTKKQNYKNCLSS